jgi:hypothetical protein
VKKENVFPGQVKTLVRFVQRVGNGQRVGVRIEIGRKLIGKSGILGASSELWRYDYFLFEVFM